MLTYLLAIAVGLGSFSLYMAAFFFPEVHRRYDLVWSGVGIFYALVLWVCAGRITGGVLLGQIASVALLGWFGWQTLTLRRAQTPIPQQTQLPESATSVSEVIETTLDQLRSNFEKSADRSPLAAQLSKAINRMESAWIGLSSWVKALTSPSLSTSKPRVPEPSAEEPSVPSPDGTSTSSNEPYAEWSELEAESHPDLDTIDGAAESYGFGLSSNTAHVTSQDAPLQQANKPEISDE